MMVAYLVFYFGVSTLSIALGILNTVFFVRQLRILREIRDALPGATLVAAAVKQAH